MKKYAVAHTDFCDNDLKIAIVEAGSPVVALIIGVKHLLNPCDSTVEWLDGLLRVPYSGNYDKHIEEIKQEFFEADQLVAVEEIK